MGLCFMIAGGVAFVAPVSWSNLLMAMVLFAVGLLGWVGISGRWSVWVAGTALLLGVLGPIALAWHATDADTCREGLQAVAGGLPAHLLAFALPAAAGAFDASRS